MNNAIKSFAKKALNPDQAVEDAKFNRWWTQAESSRKELDWKWFQYDLFTNGNHFARYDRNTQQIVAAPRTDGHAKVVINKTYATLRGVRSYVLQNRPKAEVTPYNMTDQNVNEAVKINQFLDYLHDELGLRKKLRASMWHALKYSVGFWQVLWDDEVNDGQGEIVVNVVDPYDLYIDPTARVMHEARYMILAVRRNIDDLKSDAKYKGVNWDEIPSDQLLAASPLKSRVMAFERGSLQTNENGKNEGGCIVKEYWYKEDGKIMLTTRVGDVTIRKPFDTGLNRIPFFVLPSDIEPLSLYGQGWVKNLVPLNKLLDRLESSVAEYNDLMNKGKYISDKGAGVKIINNEHGQIIEKKRQYEVTASPVPPLNPAVFEQITNVNRYIEDIGSFHDASAGRIPTGAKSGVAIEALQEGDSNNLSELVENTEEFLEDVYEYILFLASQKYQMVRNIVTTTHTGEKEFLSLIGEDAQDIAPEGATQIPSKNMVDVSITSRLAYSAEGRRQAIKDLVSMIPNLPPEFILDVYQIGNIADVVQKIRESQQQQQQQQQQMQQQQMQAQSQMQMQQQQNQMRMQQQQKAQDMQAQQSQQLNSGAGKMEAIAFIRSVLSGQKPDLPQNVSPEFINYLDEFLQSSEAKRSVPGELLSVLQQDRDQAMLNLQQGGQQQVQNMN